MPDIMPSENYTIPQLQSKGKKAGEHLIPFAFTLLAVMEESNLVNITEIDRTASKEDLDLGRIILTMQLLAFYYVVLDSFVRSMFRPVEYRTLMSSVDDELINQVKKIYGVHRADGGVLNKSLWRDINKWKKYRDEEVPKDYNGPDPVADKFGEHLCGQFGFRSDITSFLTDRYLPIANVLLKGCGLSKDFSNFLGGLYDE